MNNRKKIFDISVSNPRQNVTPNSRSGIVKENQLDPLPSLDSSMTPTAQGSSNAILASHSPREVLSNDYISSSSSSSDQQPNQSKGLIPRFLSTIGNYLIMPALIVWFMLSFIFQPFYVSGKSMEPSLHDKDYLIISKVSLSIDKLLTKLGKDNNHPLQRGDIVVFRYPAGPSTFFIKRLIGLPGDRVIIKEGVVKIYNNQYPSGLQLSEKYIDPQYKTGGDIDQVVPEDNYFVIGDNRSSGGSFDSRNWGMLPKHYVVGSVLARLMPDLTIGSRANY